MYIGLFGAGENLGEEAAHLAMDVDALSPSPRYVSHPLHVLSPTLSTRKKQRARARERERARERKIERERDRERKREQEIDIWIYREREKEEEIKRGRER